MNEVDGDVEFSRESSYIFSMTYGMERKQQYKKIPRTRAPRPRGIDDQVEQRERSMGMLISITGENAGVDDLEACAIAR